MIVRFIIVHKDYRADFVRAIIHKSKKKSKKEFLKHSQFDTWEEAKLSGWECNKVGIGYL